jgi:flagellar motility protein MotE (MotC chaperone)
MSIESRRIGSLKGKWTQLVGPGALFLVSAVGTWIALSSPLSPASGTAGNDKEKKTARKPASLSSDATGCLTDESAMADIQRRKELIEAKEKEVAARLSEVEAKEKALLEQLKKVEAARDEIKQVETLRSKEQGAKVGKVVETFETMTPKSVSSMLASMDEGLAVETMNRMTTPKLAKVMNLMEPQKSARLTELLVGLRTEVKVSAQKNEGSRSTAPKGSDVDSVTEEGREPASQE